MRVALLLLLLLAPLWAGCVDDRVPADLYPKQDEEEEIPTFIRPREVYDPVRDRTGSGGMAWSVGDKWTYVVEGGAQQVVHRVTGNATIAIGQRLYDIFKVEWDDPMRSGLGPLAEWRRTGDQALLRTSTPFVRQAPTGPIEGDDVESYDHPCRTVAWPLTLGTTRSTCIAKLSRQFDFGASSDGGRRTYNVTSQVLGQQVVVVPAGTFDSTVVVVERTWPDGRQRATYWFAPEVCGPVRIDDQVAGSSRSLLLEDHVCARSPS